MKKNVQFYEQQLNKELELAEKHKKNAADLKKVIAHMKGEETLAAVNALNLTGSEYSALMKVLKQDKKSFLKVIERFETKEEEEHNKDEDTLETS